MGATHNDHTTQSSHNRKYAAQSGQAIVLIALAMVGLIGFTGLALDGGSLLFLQRKAQTVAEMVAMSVAVANCETGTANLEQIRDEVAAVNGVDPADVQINTPPTRGPNMGQANYYEAIVNIPKEPYFIHLVYRGEMIAEGRSVSHCTQGEGTGDGYLLYATGSELDCGTSLQITGSNIHLGGSVWSNGGIQIQPGGSASYVMGRIDHVGSKLGASEPGGGWYHLNEMGGVHSNIAANAPPLPTYDISMFAPGGIFAEKALAEGLYFPLTTTGSGRYDWGGGGGNPSFPSDEGLVYVNGNIEIGFGSSLNTLQSGPRGLTIAATGQILFTGGYFSGDYYVVDELGDGVLLYSEMYKSSPACGYGNIAIRTGSAVGNYFKGRIHAPYGSVQFSMDFASSSYGSVIGRSVLFGISEADLSFLGTIEPSAPPLVYYAE